MIDRPTQAMGDLRSARISRAYWYPVALASDLRRSPLSVEFAGIPIVLARSRTGEPFALENRCAHRQVPLSLGQVEGDCIRCVYHGWKYDSAGRCVEIPHHAGPPDGRVRAFPCKESEGFVFLFPSSDLAPPELSLGNITQCSDSTHTRFYYSATVRCHYTFMHENLFDMNHQHLHGRLMGRVHPSVLDVGRGPGWVEVAYEFNRTGRRNPVARAMLGRQGDDKECDRDFQLMKIRTEYPYQTLEFFRPHTSEAAFSMWTCYVPRNEAESESRVLGVLALRNPRLRALKYLLAPLVRRFTESIFRQDREIVEAEQAAYEYRQRDETNESSPPLVALREILLQSSSNG